MKISQIKIPPSTHLKELIEQLPLDEVFSGAELAVRFGLPAPAIRRQVTNLPMNCVRLGTINYYGCMKAIKAFKSHHKLS